MSCLGKWGKDSQKAPKPINRLSSNKASSIKQRFSMFLIAHVMYIKRFFRSGFSDVLYLDIIILLKEKGDFFYLM